MSNKVLIIKLGALGDVILATPHIERIVQVHSGDDLHLLTAPAFAPLFKANESLSVTAFPRKGASGMWAALRWLRKQKFSVVYDLQGSNRSRIMTILSGAGMRIGLGPALFYSDTPAHDDINSHVFNRLNKLLHCAGIEDAPPAPRLWLDQSKQQQVHTWLKDNGLLQSRLVLMHVGSSNRWPSKRWEEEHFAQLAAILSERGYTILWIGGPDEQRLNTRLAEQVGLNVAGIFSIPQLAVLAKHAQFAVVNDSGPMHIFSTTGIAVYAFFGPTNWRRSHAIGQDQRVLTNPVSCSPCHLNNCPEDKGHRCLREITPADVLSRLERDGLV